MKIELKILPHAKEFYTVLGDDYEPFVGNLPTYATPRSAAVDLMCIEDVTIYPGEVKMIPTGLAVWIGSAFPYCGQSNHVAGIILPRSGLGTKGLVLANTIGLIDEDYQGELKISAWNRNESNGIGRSAPRPSPMKPIEIKAGARIAQLMFIPVIKTTWNIVKEFSNETQRGGGGFGHSGD